MVQLAWKLECIGAVGMEASEEVIILHCFQDLLLECVLMISMIWYTTVLKQF